MKHISPWKILIYIYVFMLVFALVFQSMPPVFGFIISSLGISHAQAGALMSFFGLPGIFISIPGGILADIYGSKKIGICALIITLIGSLMVGLGNNFSLLVTGRVISGIGALTIAIIAPQTLSQWFDKKDLGKAMGIINTAMPLGTIFTLNVFGALALASTWRVPILLTSIYCLLILFLFYFSYPDMPKGTGREGQKKLGFRESVHNIRKVGLPIWLIAAIWMMYNASAISFLTFGTDYYISVGYDASYAGFLTSLLMIGALLLSTFVGFLTDKLGNEEYFIIGGSILLTLTLFLVPRTNINPIILGVLIGIGAPFVPAPVFSLVPRFLPPERLGLGYGILSTCLNFGVLVGPLLVGLSYDLTLNYYSGFNLMAILALSGGIFALILKSITKENRC